jgi:hypothetical protein
MKKAYISVAISGLSKQQAEAKHQEYRNRITEIIGEYEDISSVRPDFKIDKETPLTYWLGKGITEEISQADIVVFCGDISQTRGCKVEKLICELYGIPHVVVV